TATVTLTMKQLPNTIITTPAIGFSCGGHPFTLYAWGASSYHWTPGSGLNLADTAGTIITVHPTTTTTYTLTGTGTNGCTKSASVTVTINQIPTVTVTPSSSSILSGDSVSLTASGANTYSWAPSTGLSATSG